MAGPLTFGLFFVCFGYVACLQRSNDMEKSIENLCFDSTEKIIYAANEDSLVGLDEQTLEVLRPASSTTDPKCVRKHGQDACQETAKISICENEKLISCGVNSLGSFCTIRDLISFNVLDRFDVTGALQKTQHAVGIFTDSSFYIASDSSISATASTSLSSAASNSIYHVLSQWSQSNGKFDPGRYLQRRLETRFAVSYLYAFTLGNFNYLIVSVDGSLRVGRFCANDASSFASYVEADLTCSPFSNHSGIKDNVISITHLETESTNFVVLLLKKSVFTSVCLVDLEHISRTLDFGVNHCYLYSMGRSVDYLKGKRASCIRMTFSKVRSEIKRFCHRSHQERFIGPLRAFERNRDVPLAIKGSTVDVSAANSGNVLPDLALKGGTLMVFKRADTILLFVGTVFGRVIKISLTYSVKETKYMARAYTDISLLGPGETSSPVKRLLLHPDKQSVYGVVDQKVVRFPVEECSQYKTCSQCSAAMDPFCGWCGLYAKCSTKEKCLEDGEDNNWNDFKDPSLKCPAIDGISPPAQHINHSNSVKINITISGLFLRNNSSYDCIFAANKYAAAATTLSPSCLECPLPTSVQLKRTLLPLADGEYRMSFGIKSTRTEQVILTGSYSFFNCSHFDSCSQCIAAPIECRWCLVTNRCAPQSIKCPSQSLLSAMEKNQTGCPKILGSVSPPVPNGIKRHLVLRASNLPDLKVLSAKANTLRSNNSYMCVISLGQTIRRISAKRLNSSMIQCNAMSLSYLTNQKTASLGVSVFWNNKYKVDSPTPVNVSVYKCEHLASDCGSCQGLRYGSPSYECAWCRNKCIHQSECPSGSQNQFCDQLQITRVSPLQGPIDGGTRVKITGKNLGSHFRDILKSTILVAGVPCTPVESDYKPSKRIVCITGRRDKAFMGKVKLTLPGERYVTSRQMFAYWDFMVHEISPRVGPISGGTRLTVRGLGIINRRSIRIILGNESCPIVSVSQERTLNGFERIECLTKPANKGDYPVIISVGNASRLYGQFVYKPNPVIEKIEPTLRIKSGGQYLFVTGRNLDAVQFPLMQVSWTSQSAIGRLKPTACSSVSSTLMSCLVPPAPSEQITNINQYSTPADFSNISRERRADPSSIEDGLTAQLSFILDRAQNNSKPVNFKMTYAVDPEFMPFEGSDRIKVHKGEALIIKGRNVNNATTKEEIIVLIGNRSCRVQALSHDKIICIPPKDHPAANDPTAKPVVMVKIGNFKSIVGRLKYDIDEPFRLPLALLIGLIVGGSVLLVAVIVILSICRRRHILVEREYKKVQYQLDSLERNVRQECKQAFAELQTDMSELGADMESHGGAPYWDYSTYMQKILFPSGLEQRRLTNHELAQTRETLDTLLKSGHSYIRDALAQFNQCLCNRQFLRIFLSIIDSDHGSKFGASERVHVASLLTVVFHSRMDHATDLLKMLLDDLIEKTVARRHAKLLLRRNESVVEKFLSNWLSLLMYDHLKAHSGADLFAMYRALRLQLDKGPVDCITQDAKYSLSEEKLLKEHTEFHPMVLNIQTPEGNIVACHVLSCDTPSQVKSKIMSHCLYKNQPFSQWPSLDSVNLEWVITPMGHMVLSDTDDSSIVNKDWSSLNTLAHYKIPDGALVRLSDSRPSVEYMTISPSPGGTLNAGLRNNSYQSSNLKLSNNCNSTFSLAFATLPSNGFHTLSSRKDVQHKPISRYHLVKPADSDGSNGSEGHTGISEIYLNCLLCTKGILQRYIDRLMTSVLSCGSQNPRLSQAQSTEPPISALCGELPVAIKVLFDYLDSAARRLNVHTDPEIVYTWKNNSLPLRFWVNIIKNPDFVFDVPKNNTIDACLSVIAQTLMDSCSLSAHRLGKDSPSNKLLFAKDIPRYRKLVRQFYSDIADRPQLETHEIAKHMVEFSKTHQCTLSHEDALRDLYAYAVHFSHQLVSTLEEHNVNHRHHFSSRLQEVAMTIQNLMKITSPHV